MYSMLSLKGVESSKLQDMVATENQNKQ